MAQLPDTYSRRPTPKFGGVDQALPVVPTGDVQLGQAYMGLGSTVMQAANRIQARQDNDELNSRQNQYQKEILALQQELSQERGAKVAEDDQFYKTWQDREDEIRQKILSENKNQRIQNDLENRLQKGNINFSRGLINHIEREREQYANDTYVGTIETAVDTMGANPDDPSMTAQMRDQIISATEDYAERRGVVGDARKNMIRENLTKGHLEVIEAKIDSGDYRDAQDYFSEFQGEIEGDKHAEIQSKIKRSGIRGQSQEAVDRYFGSGMTEKEANAAAREEFKNMPEHRDAILDRIRVRYGENAAIEARTQAAFGEQARGIYAQAIDDGLTPSQAYDLIPDTVLEGMDQAERIGLQAKVSQAASGKPVRTDMATYFLLEDFIRNNPAEAKTMDLSKYGHLISNTDLMKLNTLRHKDPKILLTEKQIIDQGVINLGIDPKELADPKSSAGERARAFRDWVQRELPHDYDKTDLQEAVKRGVIKVITDEGLIWDTTEFAYTAGTEFEVPGVPNEQVDDLALALQSIGVSPTIKNLQDAAALLMADMPITLINLEALRGEDMTSQIPTGKRGWEMPGFPDSVPSPTSSDSMTITNPLTIRGGGG